MNTHVNTCNTYTHATYMHTHIHTASILHISMIIFRMDGNNAVLVLLALIPEWVGIITVMIYYSPFKLLKKDDSTQSLHVKCDVIASTPK